MIRNTKLSADLYETSEVYSKEEVDEAIEAAMVSPPTYQHSVTLTGTDGDGNKPHASFTVISTLNTPFTNYSQFPSAPAIPVSGVMNISGEGIVIPFAMNTTMSPPSIMCMFVSNGGDYAYQPPAPYWTATITDTVTAI
jgi:hypothetical protein